MKTQPQDPLEDVRPANRDICLLRSTATVGDKEKSRSSHRTLRVQKRTDSRSTAYLSLTPSPNLTLRLRFTCRRVIRGSVCMSPCNHTAWLSTPSKRFRERPMGTTSNQLICQQTQLQMFDSVVLLPLRRIAVTAARLDELLLHLKGLPATPERRCLGYHHRDERVPSSASSRPSRG